MAEHFEDTIKSIVSGKKEYPVKSKPLWVPSLDLVAPFVESALRQNYSRVKVSSQEEERVTNDELPLRAVFRSLWRTAPISPGGGCPPLGWGETPSWWRGAGSPSIMTRTTTGRVCSLVSGSLIRCLSS